MCSEPGEKTIFTTVPRGQLGNHLHAYAILVALQKQFSDGLFLMSSETIVYLRKTFKEKNLLLDSLDQICLCRTHKGIPSIPWEWKFWDSDPEEDSVKELEKMKMRSGDAWILWPARGFVFNEAQSGISLLENAEESVRNSLVFKDSILSAAKHQLRKSLTKWMKRNKKKVKKEEIEMDDLTIVGIHHRRGDHLKYERVMRIPHIGMSYLGPSMDLFRSKYKNAVFLYVSDDKEWGIQRLSKDKDLILSWSNNDDLHAVGEDLALLSLCNHTILTRGTYSFWAATLANGKHIRPCMMEITATELEKQQRRSKQRIWPTDLLSDRWQSSLWREC